MAREFAYSSIWDLHMRAQVATKTATLLVERILKDLESLEQVTGEIERMCIVATEELTEQEEYDLMVTALEGFDKDRLKEIERKAKEVAMF